MSNSPEQNLSQVVPTFIERDEAIDVIREISPADSTYDNEANYFDSGRSALECIRIAMLLARKQTVENVLDLPCGAGRQTRFLRAAFPAARITVCDINRERVDFCASRFGATPVYSSAHPQDVRIDDRFDLIWSGSLLTHLDAERSSGFLRLFASLLRPGGVAAITTHGRLSVSQLRNQRWNYGLSEEKVDDLLSQYDEGGHGYVDHTGQVGNGISVMSPSWVCGELEKLPGLRLIGYSEMGWHEHQDVVMCLGVGGGRP